MPLNHSSSYSELTDGQYALLGKYMVEWSNCEHILRVILTRLLLTPEFLGRTYTDDMAAFKVGQAIEEAVKIQRTRFGGILLGQELANELLRINKALDKHRSFRNKIAHYIWMRNNDDEIFGSSLCGGMPRNGNHDCIVIKNSELADEIIGLRKLVDDGMAVVNKIPAISEEHAMEFYRPKK